MFRRMMIVALGCGVVAACVTRPPPPNGETPLAKPVNAPPPEKIQRLLLWIPPPAATQIPSLDIHGKVSFFNSARFAEELKKRLEAHGVQVVVGTSSGYELDRRDEQKVLTARLKPTHRLEVDVSGSLSAKYATLGQLRWVLYNAGDTTAVRTRSVVVSPQRDDSIALADDAVKRLEAEGFL
jgi:hypothetical protein